MHNDHIQCPNCGRRESLGFDNNSISVIINCPQCENLFFAYRFHGFILDPQKIKAILQAGDREKFRNIIREIIASEKNFDEMKIGHKPVKTGWTMSGTKISADDISNLRIDLGRLSSAEEIIELINRY